MGDREVREVMRIEREEGGATAREGRAGHCAGQAKCMVHADAGSCVRATCAGRTGARDVRANAGAGEASGIEAGAAISAQPVGSSMRQKPPKVARRSEEREPIFSVVDFA